MILYYNVDKNNKIVTDKSENILVKKDLLKDFENSLKIAGYEEVKWENSKRVPYDVVISKDGKECRLILYLKNITGAGWANKPNVKRVQVTNVRIDDEDKYIYTTNNQTLLILGYYNFDDNPIFVLWDAYRYVYHNTNRSCYVSIEDLIEGYEKGKVKKLSSKQEIWIFKPEFFSEVLEEYIKMNKDSSNE